MENEFVQVMSERNDDELIKIVTVERESYQPLAVEAAEAEIQKRNIDTSNFERIHEKAKIEKEQKDKVDSSIVGSGIRFVNFLIDFIIWIIVAGIITYPLDANNTIQLLLGYFLILVIFIGYYSIMEIKFQKTIGKFVTNTKVVKVNGEKPDNSIILSRTFYRLIPFDRVSFLFTKNGFHDFLSKTKVVKDNKE